LFPFLCLRPPQKEPWGKDYSIKLNGSKKAYNCILIYKLCSISIHSIITILLENNFHELFEYPIQRGEFLSIPAWWNERAGYLLNGGFFKYHPKDCKYIFDEFINNSKHWQSHYIKEGITVGPVNGEQYFVEDQVKKHLDLKFVPKSWVTRWTNDSSKNMKISDRWRKKVEDTQLFYHEHNKFNENVKFVHFTTSLNKPHESKLYKY